MFHARCVRWFVAGACLLFLLLSVFVCTAGPPRYWAWDLTVSQAVQSLESPAMTRFMRVISWAGDEVLYSTVLVASVAAILLVFRRWREAIALVCLVLLAQGLKIGIKNLVGRPRPVEPVKVLTDAYEIYSFPSGHTVHYTVTFGFLWFLTYRRVKPLIVRWPLLILCGAMVLLVGPARIYLGAHWVTDIIGGYLLGAAILAAGIAVQQKWLGAAAHQIGKSELICTK